MKIIIRNTENIAIWGTDINETTIKVEGGKFIVDGNIVAINIQENSYVLIENPNQNLPNPFYPGYVKYEDETFSYTEQYLNFNQKVHSCIQEVYNSYLESFPEYAEVLYSILQREFIEPSFQIPCPPDELFPYYPPCL
jgi:hypothetical protein